MRDLLIAAGLALSAYAAYTMYQDGRPDTVPLASRISAPRTQPTASSKLTPNQWIAYFRTSSQADSFNRVPPEAQKVLLGLVNHFCREKFESASCVQYAIVCGQPCLTGLNPQEREKIFSAYKEERKKAGLPP